MKDEPKKPLAIHFQAQNPNEKVYYLLRRHFATNTPWIITLAAAFVIPLVFLPQAQSFEAWTNIPEPIQLALLIFWYLAISGFGLINSTKWYYHVLLMTDTRLLDIDLVGFLYRNVTEAQLRDVQDVTHTQGGIFQLLFNYGNVYVQTAGTEQNLELLRVSDPGKVHDIITDLSAEAR